MLWIFWIENIIYVTAAIIALALGLLVLRTGLQHGLNRAFALFALTDAIWATCAFIYRLALWTKQGNPWFWLEASVLGLALMPPTIMLFTAHYIERRAARTKLAIIIGFLLIAALTVPLFNHHIVLEPSLTENNITTFGSTWLFYASAVPIALVYMGWSGWTLWRERRQRGSAYLAASVFIILGGIILGGVLRSVLPLPILSFTTLISILLLGYGVLSRQILNPLRELTSELERRVAERTQELEEANRKLAEQSAELTSATQRAERRAAQVTTGAEIARAATTVLDPDHLIANIVQLIQERFNCYYTGLFLIDAENRFAVLHYGIGVGSASQAGRIMKERGHKLKIGGQSMIGWACANRQARIALDVGQDAVRFANPLTPDIRSELALPLRAGERLVGALTIQSAQTAAFDQDDIAALQGMTDQVAIALENARLFTQTQQVMKELEQANRLLVRERWQEYTARAEESYKAEFRPDNIKITTGELPHILRLPLEQSGQKIGTLVMERGGEQPWSSEEAQTIQTIVQQAVLAADNARLFEESQRLAARERLINEITARIRGSVTLDGVLNSAVKEISLVTGSAYAAIDLEIAE